jgi:cytoskeletal protein CcmA (bactofilin family)
MAGKKPEPGSVIGPGLRVSGDVRTKEPLEVQGLLDGNVQVEGSVTVGRTGRIRGDVAARTVVVEGRVDGNLGVDDRVDLRVTGRIRGDIVAPRVSMAEGSFFRGRLTTARSARTPAGDGPAGS